MRLLAPGEGVAPAWSENPGRFQFSPPCSCSNPSCGCLATPLPWRLSLRLCGGLRLPVHRSLCSWGHIRDSLSTLPSPLQVLPES